MKRTLSLVIRELKRGKPHHIIILSSKPSYKENRSNVSSEKHVAQTIGKKAEMKMGEVARVLRVMVFLHSTTDFSSVLRLYGVDRPCATLATQE